MVFNATFNNISFISYLYEVFSPNMHLYNINNKKHLTFCHIQRHCVEIMYGVDPKIPIYMYYIQIGTFLLKAYNRPKVFNVRRSVVVVMVW
jgi:hypothetical protein